ncbi:MAG: NACHT domain-containing protein [Isosphaeraceae bacterium]
MTNGLFAVAAAVAGAGAGAFGTYLSSRRGNLEQARSYQKMIHDLNEVIGTLKQRAEKEQQTSARLRAALREETGEEFARYLSSIESEFGAWQGGLGLGRAVDLDSVYVDATLQDRGGERKADELFHDLLTTGRNGSNHTVIIGGPGTGKSTVLRRWAHIQAHAALQAPGLRMPFFLPLNLFARIDQSVDLGIHELAFQHLYGFSYSPKADLLTDLREYVMRGEAVILLDALDEVPREKRNLVVGWINGLANISPGNLVVVTSRPGTYTDGLGNFRSYDMVDFGDDQIRSFVGRWFDSVKTTEASRNLAVDFILGADRVLKGNPLFLTMLCVLVELGLRPQGKGQVGESLRHLTPGALLERFVHELLEHWPKEIHHLPMHVPIHDKLILLQHLAFRLFAEDSRAIAQDNLFTEATTAPSAEAMREIIETSGILQLTRDGYYRFYHPSFKSSSSHARSRATSPAVQSISATGIRNTRGTTGIRVSPHSCMNSGTWTRRQRNEHTHLCRQRRPRASTKNGAAASRGRRTHCRRTRPKVHSELIPS